MRVILEIRDEAFRIPKTPQQVAEEMRQAAAVFWVARGDVAPEAVNDITLATSAEKERAPHDTGAISGTELGPARDFKAFLLSMPDVGDDSLFERPLDYGREVDLCDT
ncbi:hypothetical protein WME75_43710 [Sorangium sp. So ce1014]|uniref:hypothetical protein n=1 Tax=Sorangium sp. So ce1014 TaxID=3133326 RepID=UPI003F64807F